MARFPRKGNQTTKAELKLLGPDDTKRKQTKERARKDKHHFTQTSVRGMPTRKMANIECGKGRGFSCTRPRGHTGQHYATHPPLTRQNIPGKRR
jgi:hypothetical protein